MTPSPPDRAIRPALDAGRPSPAVDYRLINNDAALAACQCCLSIDK
jgi:hypothetical protein